MDYNKHRFTMAIVLTMILAVLVVDISYYDGGLLGTPQEQENSISGYAIVPNKVTILPYPSSNCSFTLERGWNLVSFYCLGMLSSRSLVLESIEGSYSSIFYYDALDADDPWKSYNPSVPAWAIQDVNYLNRVNGYWIYMNVSEEYAYEEAKKSSVIPLHSGWNLIGYPSLISRNVTDAFAGVSFNTIKSYDSQEHSWLVHVPNAGDNSLHVLSTYEGYWI